MVYAVKSLALICKLKKNPKLSVECYERTLQAIHVTLADTIRENNKVKPVVFVCFVALRPKSTAMVMAERSIHLTTLFPGQA